MRRSAQYSGCLYWQFCVCCFFLCSYIQGWLPRCLCHVSFSSYIFVLRYFSGAEPGARDPNFTKSLGSSYVPLHRRAPTFSRFRCPRAGLATCVWISISYRVNLSCIIDSRRRWRKAFSTFFRDSVLVRTLLLSSTESICGHRFITANQLYVRVQSESLVCRLWHFYAIIVRSSTLVKAAKNRLKVNVLRFWGPQVYK